MIYKSKRGHALLTQETFDKPVVTLEAYPKWYEIQLLRPDGTLTTIDPDVVTSIASGLWIDHCYHPEALLLIAKSIDAYVCELSLEIAAGRWALNGKGNCHDYPLGGYILENEDE